MGQSIFEKIANRNLVNLHIPLEKNHARLAEMYKELSQLRMVLTGHGEIIPKTFWNLFGVDKLKFESKLPDDVSVELSSAMYTEDVIEIGAVLNPLIIKLSKLGEDKSLILETNIFDEDVTPDLITCYVTINPDIDYLKKNPKEVSPKLQDEIESETLFLLQTCVHGVLEGFSQ